MTLSVRETPPATPRLAALLRRVIAFALLTAVIGGLVLVALYRTDLLVAFIDRREALQGLVEADPLPAMFGFAALYFCYVAVGLPASFLLTVAGAFLFDWPIGLMLSVLSATAGATVLVLLTRYALAPLAERLAGSRLQRLAQGFNSDAVSYMLFMRLVSIFPFWLVTLAAGIFRVPLRVFVPTTLFGMTPAAFAFSMVGDGLDDVFARASVELAQCRASGVAPCVANISLSDLAQPGLMIGSAVLGVLSLLPVALRLFGRSQANAVQK